MPRIKHTRHQDVLEEERQKRIAEHRATLGFTSEANKQALLSAIENHPEGEAFRKLLTVNAVNVPFRDVRGLYFDEVGGYGSRETLLTDIATNQLHKSIFSLFDYQYDSRQGTRDFVQKMINTESYEQAVELYLNTFLCMAQSPRQRSDYLSLVHPFRLVYKYDRDAWHMTQSTIVPVGTDMFDEEFTEAYRRNLHKNSHTMTNSDDFEKKLQTNDVVMKKVIGDLANALIQSGLEYSSDYGAVNYGDGMFFMLEHDPSSAYFHELPENKTEYSQVWDKIQSTSNNGIFGLKINKDQFFHPSSYFMPYGLNRSAPIEIQEGKEGYEGFTKVCYQIEFKPLDEINPHLDRECGKYELTLIGFIEDESDEHIVDLGILEPVGGDRIWERLQAHFEEFVAPIILTNQVNTTEKTSLANDEYEDDVDIDYDSDPSL